MSMILEVTVISFGLAVLLVLISKFLTNQNEIKRIREETNELRKKIKDAQKEKNEAAVKDYSGKMFKLSQGQFKYSTRSMFASMIIVIVAFGWMGPRYDIVADLSHGQGAEHDYLIGQIGEGKQKILFYDNSRMALDVNNNLALEDGEAYKTGELIPYSGNHIIFEEPKDNKTKAVMVALSPFRAPLIENKLSWFWLYIFITLPTTLIFRKLLDVQ